MRISKFTILLLFLIILLGGYIWWTNHKLIERRETQQLTAILNKLHSVAKLVIWEQTFSLSDFTEKQKEYFGLFTTKESVITTINGKMGFHIDLADSIHTKVRYKRDTVYIEGPLKITYVSLDLSSLNQVKDRSLDPTLYVNQEEIIKHLDRKALEQYLPGIIQTIQEKELKTQEKYLQQLVSLPVKIKLTSLPQVSDWK